MKPRRSVLGLGALCALAAPRGAAAASPDERLLADLVAERDVRRLFAGYVRAVMRRDGAAVAAFFAPGAWIRNYVNRKGEAMDGAPPLRATEIGRFVSEAYHPYHPGMWSHILHADALVDVAGDRAHYSAQAVYLTTFTQGPDGAPLMRPDLLGDGHAGEVLPTNCALWEVDLVRLAGAWKIAELRIIVDIPYVASR